jgi:hypothetical protein
MAISPFDEIESFPPRARVDRDSITTSAIACGIALWWTILWEFYPYRNATAKAPPTTEESGRETGWARSRTIYGAELLWDGFALGCGVTHGTWTSARATATAAGNPRFFRKGTAFWV